MLGLPCMKMSLKCQNRLTFKTFPLTELAKGQKESKTDIYETGFLTNSYGNSYENDTK